MALRFCRYPELAPERWRTLRKETVEKERRETERFRSVRR